MHTMTKNMFRVETDEDNGRKVVKKIVDELTKNHRLDNETSLGICQKLKVCFVFNCVIILKDFELRQRKS